MKKKIVFKDTSVCYETEGEGLPLIFIHGYLESSEIWKPFSGMFTGSFRTILVDVPGHGGSGTWGEIHTMEDLSDVIAAILDEENIDKAVILGHSMGGYIAMAFMAAHPERAYALGLIHSTCFADSEEKKLNREREIALIMKGKKRQIIDVNIPKSFATENMDRLHPEVERAKAIALKTPDEGIIALLNGMKERRDHSDTQKNLLLPVLLVWGEKDNYISAMVFDHLKSLNPRAEILNLEHSGHMGFIEEPGLLARKLTDFIRSIA